MSLLLRISTATQTLEITRGDTVNIGRDPECELRLEHPSASRHHARLVYEQDAWTLIDTSSTGITFNGRDIHRMRLEPGTTVFEMPRGGIRVEILCQVDTAPTRVPAGDPGTPGILSRVAELPSLQTISIGRAPDNDVVVDDLTVSRAHAQLRLLPDGPLLVDRASHNGTYVNGMRVRQAKIADGDLIGIGGRTLRFAGGRLEEYEDRGAAWLIADSITAVRGGNTVLNGIKLAIEPSSLVAIVGPSGAGKTTFMDSLTGISPPTSGAIRYGGRSYRGGEAEWRLRLGYVPQDDLIHSQLTVRQALEYAAELRFPPDVPAASRSSRVREVMEDLGIAHRADLAVSRLSGGQRKRTSIAVELLTKPSLLFLDEPTSGLDPGNEQHVSEILRSLASEGRIVIVTTHSLASLDLCDRVLFLAVGGHVAFYGPPAEARDYFAEGGWTESYPRIFRALDERVDAPWATSFRQADAYQRYVAEPLASVAIDKPVAAHQRAPTSRPSVPRQTSILIRRYISIIVSDRRSALLLVAQAPIFAGLFLLLYPDNVMLTAKGQEVALLVWLLVIAVTWLGTSNAVREIVKERPIARREANVGVSMTSYYLSKALVLGVVTTIQAAVFGFLALIPQALPDASETSVSVAQTGIILGQRQELILGLILVGLAAMAVGLLISVVVKSSDQAMLVLPLILIAHVVVSAPAFQAPTGPVALAATLSSASWGTDALASTVDMNALRRPFVLKLQELEQTAPANSGATEGSAERPQWDHTLMDWGTSILFLLVITAAASWGTWLLLNRSLGSRADPQR